LSPESAPQQRGLRGIARSWFRRGVQVSGILWRHGFGVYLTRMGLGRFRPKRVEGEPDARMASLELPVRLRLACEEIGPVTIKLGQALASRPDLIPIDYAREFRKLQGDVPPFSWDEARKTIEGETGAPISDVFERLEQAPVASASIGQVHLGVLRGGQRVAVKVRRPNIEQTVETDLQILSFAAREAERHIKGLRTYRVSEWVDEFARTLKAELNFRTEGHNTDRLREVVAADEHVTVPRVFWEHSSSRVLILERMDGVHTDDAEGLADLGVSRSVVAARLAESVLRQILIEGFFHADPHPGNVLVQGGGRLVFLDCGNVGRMDRQMRESMVRLLSASLDDDALEVYDQIIDIGTVADNTDLQQLRRDVQRLMGQYGGVPTAQIGLGEALEELMKLIFRHKIAMPAVFSSVFRAMILTEGTCRHLSPDFDFRGPALRVAKESLQDWFRPSNLLRGIWRSLRDLQRYGMLIPRQVSEVLAQMQVAGVTLRLDPDERDVIMHRADEMVNRLASALIIAAMIVGSSVMLASERATRLLSTPGAIAYVVIGALLGLYLLYSILISKRS